MDVDTDGTDGDRCRRSSRVAHVSAVHELPVEEADTDSEPVHAALGKADRGQRGENQGSENVGRRAPEAEIRQRAAADGSAGPAGSQLSDRRAGSVHRAADADVRRNKSGCTRRGWEITAWCFSRMCFTRRSSAMPGRRRRWARRRCGFAGDQCEGRRESSGR